MELRICHMYPDVLNLYGDRGNVICMTKRLEWRGIDVSVTKLPIGDSRSLADFDLIFIGGGQDFEQQVLLSDLHRGKDREIKAAVEDGAPFLCVWIRDWGTSFDPFMETATPDTSLAAEDRPIGGLGVHLVKNVSAHHCYSGDDGTNTIELYFQLAHDEN